MQSLKSPGESGEDLTKRMKRLRKKSLAIASTRKGSINVEKRAVSSLESRDLRSSSISSRHNGKWVIPKRWLKEHREIKQALLAELREERKKELQPLDRFRRVVRLVQTCNMAFQSIIYYAIEKGQHEQVHSDATLSLNTAAEDEAMKNLMFDPEYYKCHYEFLMPRWAKQITSKEPELRTPQEIHTLVQLMRQLKGFRRYSSKIQEALCKALKYDCFGRRRMVIRRGHVAQRFYFIFSGSVCVTPENDEHSAFANPTCIETSVLNRGDFFGELAFIRGLKRALTVVCLEKTELLSVGREDFFSAKIDQCFNADMQRRVEFLKEHHVFSTWPEDVVKKIAEESRLQDYKSDEVIVRDSTILPWIIFIVKGQCDVLRLVDLSNCKDYIGHAVKYRMERIKDDTPAIYSPNADEISLSSIVFRGLPPTTESPEGEAEMKSPIRRREKSESVHVLSAEQPSHHDQTSGKGILHSEKSKGKSTKGCVSFRVEDKQDHSHNQKRRASSVPIGAHVTTDEVVEMEDDEGLIEERVDGNVGVGVYMIVDRLSPGQYFGSSSFLEQEDKNMPVLQTVGKNLDQTDRKWDKAIRRLEKIKKPRERQFALVSGGCDVIKIEKEVFFKYSDDATLEKLRKLTATYPRDSLLCQTYLQQSDWRTYREEIVDNVVVRHIARLKASKGFSRSHHVRSSPVPSPLCSLKMWPPVYSKWEFFPDAGWVSGQVTRPAIEAGTSRVNSATKTEHTEGTTSKRSSPSLGKCSPRPIRMPQGSSETPRGSLVTACLSSQTPRVSSGPPRLSSGTPRRSPVPNSLTALRSPEKLLPKVTNDLVLAQGSQRALVLTQGGSRCNDYQLQIERRIINKHDSKKSNAQLGMHS